LYKSVKKPLFDILVGVFVCTYNIFLADTKILMTSELAVVI